jgi:N-acyl-L-homoserine lactone synthetase
MAIIVESGGSERCGDRTLRAMFEDRKSVFVDLLKWDVPVLDGRFESDKFDDEYANYLIIADIAASAIHCPRRRGENPRSGCS